MTIGGALLNHHCCWYCCYCCCHCCCFANNLHTDLAAPEQLQVNAKTYKILSCLDGLFLNLKNDLQQHVITPESLNLSTLDMDDPVSTFMLIVTSKIENDAPLLALLSPPTINTSFNSNDPTTIDIDTGIDFFSPTTT